MNIKILKQELHDWNLNAKFYEFSSSNPFLIAIKQEIMSAYSLDSGQVYENILDLACGTGHFSRDLQKIGKNLISIDFSTKMLLVTHKTEPFTNCVCASASHLPFKENVFNVVIANGLFHHLKTQGLFQLSIREIRRVMKTGGSLCFLDRSNKYAANFVVNLLLKLTSLVRIVKGDFSRCSTRNELPFTESDLNKITSTGFRIKERKFIISIPFQLLNAFSNSFYYLLGRGSLRIQKFLFRLAIWTEMRFRVKSFSMEQCVKLTKLQK